ncbi:menaquinone-dependent protoporphyrinogen IX dehydrogenase [Desulfogranum japonicum]|uniref:menaquinone-dependent protoporphyrinogen IX dehydrogenase n=1 Tax=Desulfogranum japonicum TaxID=231447 RepID=UPI0004047118|nr:menaquinone-dependent protoporphyrinogen IX dehydrogenase [Desulfogranum japonicum]
MSEILIVYATTDGHTFDIALRIRQLSEQQGHRVTMASIRDEANINLNLFDKIVVGASIRYGKHGVQVYRFVKKYQGILENKQSAFFSVNLVARKPEKSQPETNPYVQKFLKQIQWVPQELAVFAGKLDYPRYRFWDRQMIRLIMWMTKGPTTPQAVIDFTDWKQVEAFGLLVGKMKNV